MNNIMWKRVKALKDIDSIDNFEKNYNLTIPTDIKTLFKNYNGGRPNKRNIQINNNDEVCIKMLLSFNKEDSENIYKVNDYFMKEFNKKVMPIAVEDGGNYFCINLDDESILYWNHESNELIKIESNLNKFLISLI